MLEAVGLVAAVVIVAGLQMAFNAWLHWEHNGERVRRYRQSDTTHRESWLRRRKR